MCTRAPQQPPVIRIHDGIHVVRDDLFPGGTKARFIPQLFDDCDELVYASPCEGGAQTAIATVARALGKRATIFVAKRAIPHPRSVMAKSLGATVRLVSPGYLSVVQARAREYVEAMARRSAIRLAPFGLAMPEAIGAIADAAKAIGASPDEVWCASGSGVLARGLAMAWPNARRHVVQVGRTLAPADVAGATVHRTALPFEKPSKAAGAFPSDRHYDLKAWEICKRERGPGIVLFWNVTSDAKAPAAIA